MTMVKSVFYACSAWVGRIDGETRCGFWAKNPIEINFDPVLLVPIDLSKTPAMARKGKIEWDEIQVDDGPDGNGGGGLTSIGPWFPDGKTTGVVYLEKQYWGRLRGDIRPPFPPPGFSAKDYEFMTEVYKDGARANRRYIGLHAKILEESGTTAKIGILLTCPPPNQQSKSPSEHKFDLSSLDFDVHVSQGGLTEIGVGPGKPKEGALFMDVGRAMKLGIIALKMPPACGVTIPASSRPVAHRRARVPGPKNEPTRKNGLRRSGKTG
jgi:hypothetical protein